MLCYRQSERSGAIKDQSVYNSDLGVSGETSINLIAVTSPVETQLRVKQIFFLLYNGDDCCGQVILNTYTNNKMVVGKYSSVWCKTGKLLWPKLLLGSGIKADRLAQPNTLLLQAQECNISQRRNSVTLVIRITLRYLQTYLCKVGAYSITIQAMCV
jgi:hypothetical protein